MELTEEQQTQPTASGPWDLYKAQDAAATSPVEAPAQPTQQQSTATGPWDLYKNADASTAQAAPQPFQTYVPRPKDLKLDPSDLQYDPNAMDAARILYNRANPTKPWSGSNKDLSDWAIDRMGWTGGDYFPGLVVDAARLANSDQQERLAFLYLMETYDKFNMSLGGAYRTVRGMISDPFTYASAAGILSALVPGAQPVAAGAVGAVAGRQVVKVATKEAFKQFLRTGVVAGIETGAFTTAQDVAKQSIYVSAGTQDGIDAGQAALSGAVGVAAGTVLGTGVAAGAQALKNRVAGKVVAKEAQEGSDKVSQEVAQQEGKLVGDGASQEAKVATEAAPPKEFTPDQLANKVDVPEAPVATVVENKIASEGAGSAPTTIQDVIAAVKKISPDMFENGGRKLTSEEVIDTAKEAGEVLARLNITDAKDAMPVLRSVGMSRDEQDILTRAAQNAFRDTGLAQAELETRRAASSSVAEAVSIQKQIDELEKIRQGLKPLDLTLSSGDASNMAARRGDYFVAENRGLTRDDILKESNINPELATYEHKIAAQQEMNNRLASIDEAVKQRDEFKTIVQEIQDLAEKDDLAGAFKKLDQLSDMTAALAKEEALKKGFAEQAYDKINSTVITKMNEYVISTVFTPSTVMLNTYPAALKMLYRPFLDFIIKGPFDQTAFREMTAFYGAMYSFKGAALQAAKAAFAYERSLLTGETNKLLERAPAIDGLKGRLLRTFPRILNATDEFFGQVMYRGFVVSQTTADAMIKGIESKLTGKALDDFVKEQVAKAVSNAYDAKTDTTNVIGFLRQQGINRGFSGDALEQWVRTELNKNGELFRTATNEEGKRFINDALFKREFSGETSVSRMAAGYEKFVNNNPWMRLAGQLFFRTPVRVFEEGIRLTPGLNLIAPNFLADLTGKNGVRAQVRAQGETMVAYSIGMSVMAMYANGAITGGGPQDWKLRRGLENTKAYDPYTIVFKDGSTFNFRNLDPFATPLKIIVNALDRYQMVQYRKSQGEYDQKSEREALAWFGVGIGAVAQAVRDASLTSGLDQIMQFAEAIGDPEGNETKFTRFVGQKAQLAVPNMLTKALQIADPQMTDPATVEQYVLSRINPSSSSVAKQHDQLGNIRTITNPIASMTGVPFTPRGWKDDSLPKKDRDVLKALSNIEIASGNSFMAPYKVQQLGDFDLREQKTSDGKETYYDRWNRYTRNMGLTDSLHTALVQNPDLSMGRKSDDGFARKIASNIISSARHAALVQMISEESGLEKRFIEKKINKVEALAGTMDVVSTPYGRFK